MTHPDNGTPACASFMAPSTESWKGALGTGGGPIR